MGSNKEAKNGTDYMIPLILWTDLWALAYECWPLCLCNKMSTRIIIIVLVNDRFCKSHDFINIPYEMHIVAKFIMKVSPLQYILTWCIFKYLCGTNY
jgi:hypothetical protein